MRRLLAAATVGLVLVAGPASAENPVLDAEDDADLAASLAEATEVQGVCYGYDLDVLDYDTGQWNGRYTTSSLGAGSPVDFGDPCPAGGVVLLARITYTSAFSEAEDSASWELTSTVRGLDIADVERLGLSSGDLLDDSRSEAVLLDAVQSLPRLATEQAGLPPVVLEPNTAALPSDARPTNTPGSDWLRENGVLLGLCVLLVLGGVVLLLLSRRAPASHTSYRPL